jgi:hypothetical protein
MCKTCFEIDQRIFRARALAGEGFDSVTVERIKQFIADLQRSKAALECGASPARP